MEIVKSYIQKIQNLFNEVRDYKYNKHRSRANKVIGKLFKSKLKNINSDKYIIFDALWDNPHHWLRLSIFGPVIADHLKSKTLGLYEKGTKRRTIDSLKAFNLDKYIEIQPKINNKILKEAKALLNDFGDSNYHMIFHGNFFMTVFLNQR